MITNEPIKSLVDPDVWKDRISELKENKYTGVCFYTDGGHRNVKFIPCSGFGIHAYFFNDDKPEGLGGFKLDYPTRRGYVEKKACAKDETVNVFKFLNVYGNINGATSQLAEIIAFIQAGFIFLDNNMHEHCRRFVIRTDSGHVVDGINDYMPGWRRNDWRKSDGRQVKNLQHWKKIAEIIDELEKRDVVVDVAHIYGHKFDTGNIIADQMATLGLYQNKPLGDEWVNRADFNATAFDFCPLLIDSKLLYYPSRNIKSKVDGKYYHYVYGNNNNQDKINTVGRNLVDSSIAVVITDCDQVGITGLYDSCRELDKHLSSTPKAIDLNVATKPNTLVEIRADNILFLPRDVDKKDIKIKTTTDKVPLVVLDPPRNSYNTQKSIDHLLSIYRSFEDGGIEDIKSIDITDQLFEKEVNGKGVTKYKFIVNESPCIHVDLPIWKESGEVKIKTPLTFGLDLPRRRVFSNIKHLNPRVLAITWYENEKQSYFATVVYVDGAVGVWTAELSNTILTEELPDEFYSN